MHAVNSLFQKKNPICYLDLIHILHAVVLGMGVEDWTYIGV